MRKIKTKKVSKRKTRRTRLTKKEKAQKQSLIDTSILIIKSSVIVILFLTIWTPLSEEFGIIKIIKLCILWLFGTMGYFFPLVMLLLFIIELTNDDFNKNTKIIALSVLYFVLICFIESSMHNYENVDLANVVKAFTMEINVPFSFASLEYNGGAIGIFCSCLFANSIGNIVSSVVYITIAIIAFLFLFGTKFVKFILVMLKNVIMFIPNLIIKGQESIEIKKQYEIDNENILKETIEKNKIIQKIDLKQEKDEELPKLVLNPLKDTEKRKFDTSKIDISSKDIQSRFFYAEKEEIKEKDSLLKEMKKKSINEILCENETVKPESFFYTDGMKPIEQIDTFSNIMSKSVENNSFGNKAIYPTIPVDDNDDEDNSYYKNNNDEINNNIINHNDINNNYEIETKDFNKDNFNVEKNENDINVVNEKKNLEIKQFASGLDELREETDGLDYENMSSNDILKNINKGIVVKNKNIKNIDMVTRTATQKVKIKKYKFPPISLLNKSEKKVEEDKSNLDEKSKILVETLKQFGVGVTLINITVGPSITRFELKPDLGVKVSKILSLEDDVKLALAAAEIRIEAPIPGKSAIGIEIPNEKSSGVMLGDIISTGEFKNSTSKLTVAIGKDISGKVITTDLRKMPHLLIAGATGSGKSVCINSLITSLIYKSSPEDVRLLMVDPKVVELQIYDGIPHLLIPVVTEPKKAANALNWAVNEMTRRYNLIQEKKVRDIESYNKAIESEVNKINVNDENVAELEKIEKLPYIVIIIDEFADLMMVASKEVENSIMRIAQLARACGIYLVIATQRPSVNVISGSIKTNVPSRISFAVSSGIDSQTILDRRGAEKLLGHGDMLYFPQGIPEPIRVQGCYVSEEEILKIVDYVKDTGVVYSEDAEKAIEKGIAFESSNGNGSDEKDDLFFEAGQYIITQQNASIGMLQRKYRIGFNRAARIIDQLAEQGIVTNQDGKKPREVIMSNEEFMQKFGG